MSENLKREPAPGYSKPMANRSTLRTVVFAFIALSLSASLVLALLEVGLRVFLGADEFYPYYPNSVKLVYPSPEITPGVSGVTRFSTNSFGTRGREPNGEEQWRILAIGGSTTADTLLDDTEAWPARLEHYLNAELGGGEKVWVANSGIDGRNSHHHLMHAIYFLPQLPPMDYVIVYAGGNDMGHWFHHREFDPDFLDDPDHWNQRIGEAFRWSQYTPPDFPIYKRTAIWKTLSRIKDRFQTASAKETEDTRAIVQDAQLRWLEKERKRRKERARNLLPKAKLDTLPIALESYGEVLTRIADEIRARGVEPIFITQVVQSIFRNDEERDRLWMGELYGGEAYVSEDQVPEIMSQFNSRMMQVAREKNVIALDLPPRMDSDGDNFYDGMHFNERGADAAAAAIAAFFWEQELLGPERKKLE